MNFNDLTEEQKAKARACKSADELIELAEAEGVKLTDEQLEAISGGGVWGCDENECEAKCGMVGY